MPSSAPSRDLGNVTLARILCAGSTRATSADPHYVGAHPSANRAWTAKVNLGDVAGPRIVPGLSW